MTGVVSLHQFGERTPAVGEGGDAPHYKAQAGWGEEGEGVISCL